ncbi:probable palmitoyltransferase ZDHHC12 isoform X1 [Ailuropoda melanoleuca]|uniref:probable palmitoyltransferase ZDHHC12 isoform X1 n=1 Tax=Ailuropoda melanoleuca TaxID=9646 RepID=UPI001493E5FD|nr:probable palmitoyltransferase ZDHHC12 isoform X1 [Ailuropoda melanoleuca]
MAPWALLSPGVLVRTGHTVLTWGITLVLFLHDTALRQWEEQGELLPPLTFLLLVLGSLLLYLAVSLMDPGYVNVQPQPQEEAKEEQTAMVPQAIPLRRCRYCLVLQPLRARHCRECRRCVRRYDHHCPWMENCVGERNHPLFVAYLALQLVVLLWGLYLAWWVPLPPWVRGEGRSMRQQGKESQDSLLEALDLLPNGLPTRAPWGTPALLQPRSPSLSCPAGLASISSSLGGCGCGPAGCCLPPSCCSPSSLWGPACSSPRTSTWWPATPPPGSSSPRTALPTSASAPATPSTAA